MGSMEAITTSSLLLLCSFVFELIRCINESYRLFMFVLLVFLSMLLEAGLVGVMLLDLLLLQPLKADITPNFILPFKITLSLLGVFLLPFSNLEFSSCVSVNVSTSGCSSASGSVALLLLSTSLSSPGATSSSSSSSS